MYIKKKSYCTPSFFQDLTSAERARKAVEAERDELLEEINNNTASK